MRVFGGASDVSIASDARFWDRTSRKYAKAAIADQDGYERTLDRTRSLLGAGDRVLELGCGTGTTALRLSGDVKSYLATDFSVGMITIAEEKRIAARVPVLEFRTATAESIELETGQFDAILGFNYLHLVRDLPGTLRRIRALLVSEGLFISKTPCVGDMNSLIRLVLLPVMRAARQGTLCRCFWHGGSKSLHVLRGLRHPFNGKPLDQGLRQPLLYRGAQEMTRTAKPISQPLCHARTAIARGPWGGGPSTDFAGGAAGSRSRRLTKFKRT
jgi:SAM-dependent methyltransferase